MCFRVLRTDGCEERVQAGSRGVITVWAGDCVWWVEAWSAVRGWAAVVSGQAVVGGMNRWWL